MKILLVLIAVVCSVILFAGDRHYGKSYSVMSGADYSFKMSTPQNIYKYAPYRHNTTTDKTTDNSTDTMTQDKIDPSKIKGRPFDADTIFFLKGAVGVLLFILALGVMLKLMDKNI